MYKNDHSSRASSPEEGGTPVLVNLGCGLRFHRAWKNFDLHSRRAEVTACNFLKGIPLPDASADAIYCAAVLEHIERAEVPEFLAECHRVLKPGGIIRVSVPDFEAQARLYLSLLDDLASGDSAVEDQLNWILLEMLDQCSRDCSGGSMAEFLAEKGEQYQDFIRERIGQEGADLIPKLSKRGFQANIDLAAKRSHLVRGGFLGRWLLKLLLRSEDVRADLAALEVGRFRLRSGEVHRWAYSFPTLAKQLERAGFAHVERMEHGVSRVAGWESYGLEVNVAGQVEKPDLMVLEAAKPQAAEEN